MPCPPLNRRDASAVQTAWPCSRRRVLWGLPGAAATVALGPQSARAGTGPAKPVRRVIPFPADAATDCAARAVGGGLADLWGQAAVFDNEAGAGSTLGRPLGAKSAADGYTLVMGVPAATLSLVERDVKTVTDSTRLRGLMWQRGAEVDFSTAKPSAAAVKADRQRWKVVAPATGARAE